MAKKTKSKGSTARKATASKSTASKSTTAKPTTAERSKEKAQDRPTQPARVPGSRRAVAAAAAARKRRMRRRALLGVGGAVLLAALVIGLLVARDDDGGGGSPPIEGLVTFKDKGRKHVTTPVSYPEVPPVGGDHAPVPQTCGVYGEPIPNENGVHSMEHGAVWITYRPDLPAQQVDRLRALAKQSHMLVSPFPDLPAPVVASAWERQLRLESADDPRLQRFVEEFREGPQAPERGAACTGQGAPLT